MSNQTYDEKFMFLTESEIVVLNAKCKGVKLTELAQSMGYPEKWAYDRLSIIYEKLGIDVKLHPREKAKVLSNEVCPKLQEFLKNRPG